MTMGEPPPEYERLLAVAERERAPLALRERIDADRERLPIRAAVRRRLRLAGALAAAAAVAGIVVGLAVPGGDGDGAPTALDAAALGVKPAMAAAPPRRESHPETLEASVGGVRFPTWGSSLRWEAAGYRRDELAGRDAETVFYEGPGATRLGYTIVDGDALPWPQGSRTVARRGVTVHLVRHRDRVVAVWRVKGRTCVISAPAAVAESQLVKLASTSSYS